jgi:hypothetical protein
MRRSVLFGLVVVLGLSVLAFSETTFDSDWFGSGDVNLYFDSGDDFHSEFHTGGMFINGFFVAKDKDDNPYGYGVDSSNAYVQASVSDGFMAFLSQRLDTKSSYGPAGQRTGSYVYTEGEGYGEMAFGTSINYAACKSCGYGWRKTYGATTNGMEFEAAGSYFEIDHWVDDGNDTNPAYVGNVGAMGSGLAMIKLMGQQATGNGGFNMGHLGVCGDGEAWDNNYARFQAEGEGLFYVHAKGEDYLSVHEGGFTIPGDGTAIATYDLQIQYGGSFSWDDFGVKGK